MKEGKIFSPFYYTIAINKKKDKICNSASKLYNICSSNLFSPIKMRCCDFETLEVVCKGWEGLYEENINQ